MKLSKALKEEKKFTNDLIAYTPEGQLWFNSLKELLKYLLDCYEDEKQIATILESNNWKVKDIQSKYLMDYLV